MVRKIDRDSQIGRRLKLRDLEVFSTVVQCGSMGKGARQLGVSTSAVSEVVAEMNAAFCCASLGIVPSVRHADYLGSWLEVLKEDNRAIIRAASQASKAADYILGFLPPDDGHILAATHDTGEAIEAA
jgi:antirestriction protein ArdC